MQARMAHRDVDPEPGEPSAGEAGEAGDPGASVSADEPRQARRRAWWRG